MLVAAQLVPAVSIGGESVDHDGGEPAKGPFQIPDFAVQRGDLPAEYLGVRGDVHRYPGI